MTKKKLKFYEIDKTLKKKMGDGGIPDYILKKCQQYLESNPIDFTPHAVKYLDELNDIKNKIENNLIDEKIVIPKIVNIVMQLKSNGSMFHYQLISMTSDVMLRFMEKVTTLDKDFLAIFSMHNRILETILTKRLNGNGGREGQTLTQELHSACLRYYSKNNIDV